MEAKLDLMQELASGHKAGLPIRTPIILASGCAGFGDIPRGLFDLSAISALVTLPATLRSHRGRPDSLIELPGGALLTGEPTALPPEVMCRRHGSAWRAHNLPVVVRLGPDPAEWPSLADAAGRLPQIAAVECDTGQMNAENAGAALAGVVAASDVPVLARFPCTAHGDVALALADAGANALVIGNPVGAIAWSPYAGRFMEGEIAGAALLPLGLAALRRVRAQTSRPVVMACGVCTPRQAVEALLAGATAVQIGHTVLADPGLPARMLEAIRQEMAERGLGMITELIGREAG